MVKKVILSTLLVGLIGVLVAGGIIRTVDKTGQVAEAAGLEKGRGYDQAAEHGAGEEHDCDSEGQEYGHGQDDGAADRPGQGRSCGRGQGGASAGEAERQYPNYEAVPGDQVLYQGTVSQAPAVGVDLVIVSDAGEEIMVGTGPGYMEAQGFSLQAGEAVELQGFWEDGELKATQVTRLRDGQTITLRDEAGHPEWAGSGKRAAEQGVTMAQQGQDAQYQAGQGQGGRGQGGQGQSRLSQGGQGQGSYNSVERGTLPGGGDLSELERDALMQALQDEYKAWSVYEQVIADFGAVRPFTNIQRAEENHIAALVNVFNAYGLDVPANEWQGNVPTFDTLAEACAGGVQAEIDNAALYDQLFNMVEEDNPDIIQVFTALQRASQNQHLPAFERCAP